MQQNDKPQENKQQNNKSKQPAQAVYKPKPSPPQTTTTVSTADADSPVNGSTVVPAAVQQQQPADTQQPQQQLNDVAIQTDTVVKPKRVRNRKKKSDRHAESPDITSTDDAAATDAAAGDKPATNISQFDTVVDKATTQAAVSTTPSSATPQTASAQPKTLRYNIVHKPTELQISFKAPLIQQRNDIALTIHNTAIDLDFNTRPQHFAYNPLHIDLSDAMQQYGITDIKQLKHRIKYFADNKKFVLTFVVKPGTQQSSSKSKPTPAQSEPVEEEFVIEVSDTLVSNNNHAAVDALPNDDRLSPVHNDKENEVPVENVNTNSNSVVEPMHDTAPSHRDSIDSNGNVVKSILRTRSNSEHHSNGDRKIKFNIDQQLYELDELQVDLDINENNVDSDIVPETPSHSTHPVQPQQIQKIDKTSPRTDTRSLIKQKQPNKPVTEIDELADWIEKGKGNMPKKLQKSQQQLAAEQASKPRQKQKQKNAAKSSAETN